MKPSRCHPISLSDRGTSLSCGSPSRRPDIKAKGSPSAAFTNLMSIRSDIAQMCIHVRSACDDGVIM